MYYISFDILSNIFKDIVISVAVSLIVSKIALHTGFLGHTLISSHFSYPFLSTFLSFASLTLKPSLVVFLSSEAS